MLFLQPNSTVFSDEYNTHISDLDLLVLFSRKKITVSCENHSAKISKAPFEKDMSELLTFTENWHTFSIGFDLSDENRQLDTTNHQTFRGKRHVNIKLKVNFVFAADQLKATSGFGYKVTTKKIGRNVFNSAAALDAVHAEVGKIIRL